MVVKTARTTNEKLKGTCGHVGGDGAYLDGSISTSRLPIVHRCQFYQLKGGENTGDAYIDELVTRVD